MLGFALYLASFYVFVSLFSDGAESRARWQIFAVALVATVLLNGISNGIPTLLGVAIACLVAAGVSLGGLIFWIRVTRLQAVKITASYIGFVVAYSLVITLLFGAFGVHAA
jgi:hypothetical protein